MAIQSASELDFVLTDIILKIDRALAEQPRNAPLAAAGRDLKQLASSLRKGNKPTSQELRSLQSASSTVRDKLSSDEVYDRMLDIEDFVQSMAK
jgi:hypothetical protein